HRFEHPVKHRDDGVVFVVRRYDDRNARLLAHTLTPPLRTFHMSATGLSVTKSRYSGCGVAMTRTSLSSSTCCSGTMRGSFLTYGSVQSTRSALNARIRRSLYDRLDLTSSEPPLKAMPRIPTVKFFRSNFCSSLCTR